MNGELDANGSRIKKDAKKDVKKKGAQTPTPYQPPAQRQRRARTFPSNSGFGGGYGGGFGGGYSGGYRGPQQNNWNPMNNLCRYGTEEACYRQNCSFNHVTSGKAKGTGNKQ